MRVQRPSLSGHLSQSSPRIQYTNPSLLSASHWQYLPGGGYHSLDTKPSSHEGSQYKSTSSNIDFDTNAERTVCLAFLRTRARGGFTLVELIVTLLIAGVVIGVSVTFLTTGSSFLVRTEMSASAKALAEKSA
ncbi:MAG: prepilin-type N-terminal cleavage/methylation domain-containing protein [Clostridiales Family XIII bacterium]|nr:prepilin-type N-terminal cleavage/methylation domain-containing protein [Clostridiales Family XIII bacterium]